MTLPAVEWLVSALLGAISLRPPEGDSQRMVDAGKPLDAGFLSIMRGYHAEDAPAEVRTRQRTTFFPWLPARVGVLSRGIKCETDPETIERELVGFLVEGRGKR